MSKLVQAVSSDIFLYDIKAETSTTGHSPSRGFYVRNYFYEIEPVWTDIKGNLVEYWGEELEAEFKKLV